MLNISTHTQQLRGSTYKAVIINGINELLLGNQETKATTGTILEGDAIGLGTKNAVDVIAIVELIVEALRDPDHLSGISILDDDQMVWLKEWPPVLQEVQAPYGWYHYVYLILQYWSHFLLSYQMVFLSSDLQLS